MQTTLFAEYQLSQLMLGTVQFGLKYGVANKVGQPSYKEARDILACAFEGGVNCLDTAAGYGTSEEVIGKAAAELGIADQLVVVTKIVRMHENLSSAKASDEIIEESVIRSLKRLRLDVLPICLFHCEDNWQYVDSLLKLKDKGRVKHIGSSVMTPDAAFYVVHSGQADAVQIPTNLFDHRFTRGGFFEEASAKGVALFVRSIYMQGLVMLPENEILPELTDVIPIRRKLEALAHEAGISLSELAVRYVISLNGLTCALVGVDTIEQMRQNLDLFAKGPLDTSLMEAIRAVVSDFSDDILMPNRWSKRMPDTAPERR